MLLRRPFSIAGLRRRDDCAELDMLGRVVGRGAAWLAARRPGDDIDILGPLGRPFSAPPAEARALLVAGGVGLPPIRWLGEKLAKLGIPCAAVYGATTRDLLPITLLAEPTCDATPTLCVGEFAQHGIPTIVATDDGTCGMRGRVTDALMEYVETRGNGDRPFVYACGPAEMLRAVASFSGGRGLPCELAIERMMGCGMGTCQSCVVRVTDPDGELGWRYALCCTEGPVFNAARLLWK